MGWRAARATSPHSTSRCGRDRGRGRYTSVNPHSPSGGIRVRTYDPGRGLTGATKTESRPLAELPANETYVPRRVRHMSRDITQRRGGDSNPRWTERPIPVFETGAFNRSATSPVGQRLTVVERASPRARAPRRYRRGAKNPRSSSAHSSASSPLSTCGRWLSRGSARTSSTLPAAPALGSVAP